MNPRLIVLGLGLALGYVLGTRDGRERYDAMKAKVTQLWEDPRVAKVRKDVEEYAREQAPIIRERATAAAKAAPGFAKDVAQDVAEKVSTTAKDVASKASSTAKDVADRAKDVASDLRERGENLVDSAVASAGVARDAALDDLDDEDDAKS
jgi:hypothetical protein